MKSQYNTSLLDYSILRSSNDPIFIKLTQRKQCINKTVLWRERERGNSNSTSLLTFSNASTEFGDRSTKRSLAMKRSRGINQKIESDYYG